MFLWFAMARFIHVETIVGFHSSSPSASLLRYQGMTKTISETLSLSKRFILPYLWLNSVGDTGGSLKMAILVFFKLIPRLILATVDRAFTSPFWNLVRLSSFSFSPWKLYLHTLSATSVSSQ